MRKLKDYNPFLKALLKTLCDRTHFESNPPLSEILKSDRLVVAMSHATPLSWIPAMSLLSIETENAGGGGRMPYGVVDRWMFSNPMTRGIAEYVTQSDRPLNFDELVEKFQSSQQADLVIFPEGANSFFSNVHEVHQFRSPRFIEIAMKANAPILMAVHKGSEGWSLPLQIPKEIGNYLAPISKFFSEKILKSDGLNIPLWPQKMDRFAMRCEQYKPTIEYHELPNEPAQRRQQLETEAEKIRVRMNEMLLTL
jgi:1-acyl-sn-glycerol-3-phosphate acyltransferase